MSNPPPAKRLKQSSIFEALKKQGSKGDGFSSTKDEEEKVHKVTRSMNKHDKNKQDVTSADKGDSTERNKSSTVCTDAEKPGGSKDQPVILDGEPMSQGSEPMSQGSAVSGDYNDSPLLFSDSDLEDVPDPTPSVGKSTKISSRGTSIKELKTYPDCLPKMPALVAAKDHTVLIKTPYKAGDEPVPFPSTCRDMWDADHVKLPSSPENLYPVETKQGKKLNSRWELIQTALLNTMTSSIDLEEAILKYNTRYNQRWNFNGLHSYFTEVCESAEVNAFFKNTLPKMVELALQLPQLCTQPVPMLKKGMNHSITLSQKQVASLLANAFFCTFPRRNTAKKQSEYSLYPDINFSPLFQGSKHPKAHRKAEKLKCILNYFRRVTKDMPRGTVTFRRQCMKEMPDWKQSARTLTRLHSTCTGTIEDDGHGMLQVDFANKYLGGGVLGYGCVQEEIRFLICPELLLSRLFTEELDRDECLVMTGSEQFSNYTGYADSFQWSGNHIDTTPRDCWGRRCTDIVAIDALIFRTYVDQFHENLIKRELNKAYCGFLTPGVSPEHLPAVATGNWGCGAFGGDLRLKALLQLLAASEAQRDVCYFTFNNYEIMEDLYHVHQFIGEKSLSVSDVYSLILQYNNSVCRRSSRMKKPSVNLYQYIYSVYNDYGDDTDTTENTDRQSGGDFDESSQEARQMWTDSPDYAANTP